MQITIFINIFFVDRAMFHGEYDLYNFIQVNFSIMVLCLLLLVQLVHVTLKSHNYKCWIMNIEDMVTSGIIISFSSIYIHSSTVQWASCFLGHVSLNNVIFMSFKVDKCMQLIWYVCWVMYPHISFVLYVINVINIAIRIHEECACCTMFIKTIGFNRNGIVTIFAC